MKLNQINDYPRPVRRTDLEIVKNLLKTRLGVEAEIPSKEGYHIQDIFIMTTKALKAKLVVELGTGMGQSCGAFVTSLKETVGMLYSVDLHPEAADVSPTIQKYSGTDAPVIFITGDSVAVGRSWSKGDIDILYCDSNHKYDHVLNELETWKNCNPKVIFIHDTLDHGRINEPHKAGEEFARRSGRKFVNLNFTAGLGVMI